ALDYLSRLRPAPERIELSKVEPASAITPRLASGAMSHGALVATAHEAVAHGTNMVGGMSNSGEGGEHISRYGTIRASRIKQFASGRFGVWAGYLADPNLEEIEIKIGQGAKPGEGGQLPAPKVTVEIAAARGGTPGVELISPPPHHDTYSIEDLGQLIHDAKAARKRVIVKLVSSEGIGTIAVGVAKAGADVINVAGNTGGTGAASVTSLKYTGRAAEIGIAEVHQALCANGIRQKVVLRCSGAMQTGSDVVKASLMGGDSFEFGTTALMMLKCVMAKNCNVKCPAGLTTNPEVFDGDPRALAQYLLNIAHEVREILANLGLRSLDEARGRADLLHLLDHPASVGQLNLRAMLTAVPENRVEDPIYLERDFAIDDVLLDQVKARLLDAGETRIELRPNAPLNNRNKTVGGQLSIDIERMLNHDMDRVPAGAFEDARGRRFLDYRTIRVVTNGSAGQSFGAFCNDGIVMEHTGTCNDGVGKGASGGEIIVRSPGGGREGENVLIGNFALFGATGGRTFIEGQAGDRFAVRNSGATAVVEGVGDFCAEYMTNGAILNLGGFSKGYGNGMSGGFAYQYDPEGRLAEMISTDSVFMGHLGDGSAQAEIHEDAVKQLLSWHVEATGSDRAQALLGDWENVRERMAWVMPKALLQYQDADEILAARSRKDLVEELATALAGHQVATLKAAWKAGKPMMAGAAPNYGEMDTEEMFRLLNSYTVLEQAQTLAAKRVGKAADRLARDKAARNLVLTEDFALMAALAKHARTAIADYDDAGLAVLVANKRLSDFKRALSLRNILSMDSPGTYAWILHQDRKNRDALGEIPSFDALFAQNALPDLLARTAAE
ncbi:MAG: glutamate synthase-related protein, partial [Pseudomonadota bacterium]